MESTKRSLCGTRLDNVYSFTSHLASLPTTCFEDVVLVPLATWIYLLLLLLLFVSPSVLKSSKSTSSAVRSPIFRYRFGTRSSDAQGGVRPNGRLLKSSKEEEGVGGAPTTTTRSDEELASAFEADKSWTRSWPRTASSLSVLYSVLILCSLLMNVLELVRLYLSNRGGGLLPFTLLGILLVLLTSHLRLSAESKWRVAFVNLTFWALSLTFTAVKLATLSHLSDIEPRKGSKYMDSDQIIDVAVILGLYTLFFVAESFRSFSLIRK
ncbi:hypothetical protein IE53DRAFT_391166 [Violaceomyces palustris]|uniref:Uncharacterized protein n=1 Tax=Violaceomyces palustris TaxID=1673888 RepID=A0ACD0NLP7_9BASI|nr:hypothetical protein IE53DRAFT_391166 [Violaceomyces palustris]